MLGHYAVAVEGNTDEIFVKFKVNSSAVDTTYCDNANAISRLINKIDSIDRSKTTSLSQIVISGSSSPEGPLNYNRQLSDKRLKAVRELICMQTGVPDSIIVETHRITDWQRLAEMIITSNMSHKEEALTAMARVAECCENDAATAQCKNELMALNGGKVWRYMMRHFFPALRNACTVIIASAEETTEARTDEKRDTLPVTTASDEVLTDTVAESSTRVALPAEDADKDIKVNGPRYMSIYTNMLYDALLTPNIGVEIYLGKNFSIGADWKYGWWKSDRRHRYWRIYGGAITLRHWFGSAAAKKPLTGHHLGIYGEMFTYDFEFGDRGQMGGEPRGTIFDRANYAAGIEYGYSLPVSKHLNIDFSLGIGYLGGKYYEYKPSDGHYVWQTSKQRHWFGPTRASVSLVWLIGRGNINRKGGREL